MPDFSGHKILKMSVSSGALSRVHGAGANQMLETCGGFISRVERLLDRISRSNIPDPRTVSQLRTLVPEFTVRDCLKVICLDSRRFPARDSLLEPFAFLSKAATRRLTDLVKPENLELSLLALSRLKPEYVAELVIDILNKVPRGLDSSPWFHEIETKELANIANIVSKIDHELNRDLLPICVDRLRSAECDHRAGTLIVCSVSRQARWGNVEMMLTKIDSWCEVQNERVAEWSAQSVALFVHSMAKLGPSKEKQLNIFSLIINLTNDKTDFSSNYTNQNLCNLLAGIVKLRLNIQQTDYSMILEELGNRTLLKRDLLFLSRVKDALVSRFVASKILPEKLTLAELAVLCDIAPQEYEPLRSRLVECLKYTLENPSSLIQEQDTERMFYIIHKLNYNPGLIPAIVPRTMSGEKAALCLLAIFRQEITVSVPTLNKLVDLVLQSPASPSDLTTTLLAVVSIAGGPRCVDTMRLQLLVAKISESKLNAVDIRQIHKAVSVNHLLDLKLPFQPLLLLINPKSPDLKGTPLTSRGHSEVHETLKKLAKKHKKKIECEVHAPPLVIDILVT